MLKVIIADDEKWVRATINGLLPYEKFNLELVSEAANGNEAFEQCLKLQPDILLTDIRMPKMDGLELIEQLRLKLPNLITIIISGYDDFKYAQQAVKIGAFDYLLKPVGEDELNKVIEKAALFLSDIKKKKEKELQDKNKSVKSLKVMKVSFLNSLLSENNTSFNEVQNSLKEYDIKFSSSLLKIIVLSVADYSTLIKNVSKKEKVRFLEEFEIKLNLFAKKFLEGVAFPNKLHENEFVVIFNGSKLFTDDNISTILKNIQKVMKRRFDISFSAGISRQAYSLLQLNQAFQEAEKALAYKIINGNESINIYKSEESLSKSVYSISEDIVDEVVLNMELNNKANLNSQIDHIFELISTYKDISPTVLKKMLWKFLIDIVQGLNCKDFQFINLYDYNGGSLYEEYKEIDTLPGFNNYIKKFCYLLINCSMKSKNIIDGNVVQAALNFIDEKYDKSISLDLLAEYVHMNSAYFCNLFKKETGQNFIEYLTKVRIEKAKELLSSTSLKTYDICLKVGYSEAKYFGKLFKKCTGLTPIEYRNLMNKN